MSGPQPWPGPDENIPGPPPPPSEASEASGRSTPPAPATSAPATPMPSAPLPTPPPPAAAPSAALAENPKSAGRRKVVAWSVAGTVLVCALLAGGLIVANSMMGNVLWGGSSEAGSHELQSGKEPVAGNPVPETGTAGPTPSSAKNPATRPPRTDRTTEPAEPTTSATPSASAKSTPTFGVPANDANPNNYSNADKAYCKWSGTVRYVAASEQFRAAICDINGQATYLGMDKKTGLTTRLPAVISGNSVQAAKDNFTYSLDADSFRVSEGGTVIAEQKMLSWWTPDAPELKLPGDLGLSKPISFPSCDGTGVLVLQTFFDPPNNIADIQAALDKYPDAEYLRTDLSCDNFRNPSTDNSFGNSIYAVYRTMKADEAAMCKAMKELNSGGDWLENNVDPTAKIECPKP